MVACGPLRVVATCAVVAGAASPLLAQTYAQLEEAAAFNRTLQHDLKSGDCKRAIKRLVARRAELGERARNYVKKLGPQATKQFLQTDNEFLFLMTEFEGANNRLTVEQVRCEAKRHAQN